MIKALFILWMMLGLVACGERVPPQAAPSSPTGVVTVPPPLTPTPTPTPPPTVMTHLSATPLPSATPTVPLSPTRVPLGVVNAAVVNVRSGPGLAYEQVGQVQQGETYPLVGRNEAGDWWRICCVGAPGQEWIKGEFLDINLSAEEAAQRVALAPIPPSPIPAPTVPAAPPGNTQGGSNAARSAAPIAGLPPQGNFSAPGATNPLTGAALPAGRNQQRPVAICINNDAAARPQFGMGQADVVYEYIMEGWGITRFTALFYGQAPNHIGPVRSARLINFHLGALYDAGTICSGASDPVRYLLKKENPYPYLDVDLDDASNTRYTSSVTRDYRTRVRTSMEGARRWLARWEVERAPAIRGFTFGPLPAGGVEALALSIPYPRGSQVSYRYDAASGRYLRFLAGAAHTDGNTGAQLAVENVIIQYTPHEKTDIIEDSLGNTSIRISLFGRGKALLFRDGRLFEGSWQSESRGDTPRFYDAQGHEIPLKPGQSWISVVPFDYNIGY